MSGGKFDRKAEAAILKRLRVGSFFETAAAAAGVSRDTLHEWRRKGAAGKEPYAAFARKVDQAMAAAEASEEDQHDKLVARLAESRDPLANGQALKAMQWRMSRRYARHYGDRTKSEVELTVPEPISVVAAVTALSNEELLIRGKEALRALGQDTDGAGDE